MKTEVWTYTNPANASTVPTWQEHWKRRVGNTATLSVHTVSTPAALEHNLLTATSAGSIPNLVIAEPPWLQRWFHRGIVRDLATLTKHDPEVTLTSYISPIVHGALRGAHLTGLPVPAADFIALFINPILLERAGLLKPPPSYVPGHKCPVTPALPLNAAEVAKWDWTTLANNARILTQKGEANSSGFWYPLPNFFSLVTWMYSDGEDFFTPATPGVNFNLPATQVTLTFLHRLQTQYGLPPAPIESSPWPAFIAGRLPIAWGHASSVRYLLKTGALGVDFDTIGISPGPNADRSAAAPWSPGECTDCLETEGYASYGSSTTSWSFLGGILQRSSYPDNTWRTLKAAGDRMANTDCVSILGLPGPRRDVFASTAWQQRTALVHGQASWPDLLKSGGPFPTHHYFLMSQQLTPVIQQTTTGKLPVKDALRQFVQITSSLTQTRSTHK